VIKKYKKKHAIIFGASSLIAQNIAQELYSKDFCLSLIGRDKAKINSLIAKLKPNKALTLNTYFSSLDTLEKINESIYWIEQGHKNPDLIFICPGVIFADDANIEIDKLVESINLNTLLPLMVNMFFLNYKNIKIATLGSLFSIAPKKGKLFYSYTKKLYSVFFKNHPGIYCKSYLFNLGPVYTPMYNGPSRFYVSKPDIIAKNIVEIVLSRKPGIYYLPKLWFYLVPLIFLLNLT
jgi:short-subunit dehydrogenase